MIIRLVKMTFKPESVDEFISTFREHETAIRNFPGCSYLELLRETEGSAVFFTHSHWDKQSSLKADRDSELFNKVWALTVPLFSEKPEAWSAEKVG